MIVTRLSYAGTGFGNQTFCAPLQSQRTTLSRADFQRYQKAVVNGLRGLRNVRVQAPPNVASGPDSGILVTIRLEGRGVGADAGFNAIDEGETPLANEAQFAAYEDGILNALLALGDAPHGG